MKNIWVLCGGPSTEFEVSISSGLCVCQGIDTRNYRVRPVIVTRSGAWIISERIIDADSPRDWLVKFFDSATHTSKNSVSLPEAMDRMIAEPVDCAFLAFHGQYGEDGAIQGMLQTADIAYTGSGILSSALAFNKSASLDIFAKANLPVARHVLCTCLDPAPAALGGLKYPVFTKPVCGGSSLGVSLVKDPAGLHPGIQHALEHDDRALVEEKIPGVEVSCGVIDFVEGDTIVSRAMPPTLISPTEAEFFDFEAKYVPGKSKDVTPAPLPPALLSRIQEIALAAHKALFCEGMSRTDLITLPEESAQPVILETQTLPGMTPTSLIPQQCAAAGITFTEFVSLLIIHALWRKKARHNNL